MGDSKFRLGLILQVMCVCGMVGWHLTKILMSISKAVKFAVQTNTENCGFLGIQRDTVISKLGMKITIH